MTTPFPFVSGAVLTAQQLNDIQNLPISDKTASYVLVVGDVTKRTIMNSASATTITVDDAIFTVGDVIQVANKGAGVCTITAGSGVTINTSGSLALAQYGGGYLLCLSASTFTFFNLSGGAAIPTSVEYLVIAGGGGGGGFGGGGGGGYRNSVSGEDSGGGAAAETPFAPTKGVTYTITVGAGGAGGSIDTSQGSDGVASSIAGTGLTTISSTGGGGGGAVSDANKNGRTGGSGGGGGINSTTPFAPGSGGAGTTNEGFAGGAAAPTGGQAAGGGGGSDAVGSAGVTTTGGNGGAGNSSSISGTSVGRGGGGGGAGSSVRGTGTQGGGNGQQFSPALAKSEGTVNTGGGGGGGYGAAGAAGGKGVVIIRTLDTVAIALTTGATLTNPTGYFVYTFNDSGTIKWGN
jgi:hypothetical protein